MAWWHECYTLGHVPPVQYRHGHRTVDIFLVTVQAWPKYSTGMDQIQYRHGPRTVDMTLVTVQAWSLLQYRHDPRSVDMALVTVQAWPQYSTGMPSCRKAQYSWQPNTEFVYLISWFLPPAVYYSLVWWPIALQVAYILTTWLPGCQHFCMSAGNARHGPNKVQTWPQNSRQGPCYSTVHVTRDT